MQASRMLLLCDQQVAVQSYPNEEQRARRNTVAEQRPARLTTIVTSKTQLANPEPTIR